MAEILGIARYMNDDNHADRSFSTGNDDIHG